LCFEVRVEGFGAAKAQKEPEKEGEMLSPLLRMGKSYSTACRQLQQAQTLPADSLRDRSLGRR